MFFLVLALTAQLLPQSAGVPNRQPQLAVNGNRVMLCYGAGNRIYFADSIDQGKSWSRPVLVSTEEKLMLGMRRGPRIAATSKAIVISAIVTDKRHGAAGDLVAWRSTDGGKTWSSGRRVNDVPSSAREGLQGMAAGENNLVFVAWLDDRSGSKQVYGSVSRDGGASWSPNRLVYKAPSGPVCECCHPSAAIDAQGRIYVMFRNLLEGHRDMYLVRSEDGGRSFGSAVKQGSGTWKLNACPMDGGSLRIDNQGRPITVWRREEEVYLSEDSGPEHHLGHGKQPVLAVTGRGVYTAWTDGMALQVVAPGEKIARTVAPKAAYPSMVALPNGRVLLAWEQNGTVAMKTLQ